MKKLAYTISQIVFILLVFSTSVSAKNKLTLECQILDPANNQPKTIFAPGDDMLLSINVQGPNDGSEINTDKDQKLAIQISSSAKIAGVKIPFQFKNNFSIPLSKTIKTDSKKFKATPSQVINIPTSIPKGSKLKLQVKTTLSSVGSKTCKQSISVE